MSCFVKCLPLFLALQNWYFFFECFVSLENRIWLFLLDHVVCQNVSLFFFLSIFPLEVNDVQPNEWKTRKNVKDGLLRVQGIGVGPSS